MIIFKNVEFKNFLSSGNNPITVTLDKHDSTLIRGANGAGKSTIAAAIVYGLFGVPYRDIKKPQLVNSINKRDCLVTVEFAIGTKDYKVVRGMKPNVFEIWENGNLLSQAASARDHQKHLEQNILKHNVKTFKSVVLLGSGNYVPFMRLSSGARREVIEDLLDITVFSRMNQIIKERLSVNKEMIRECETNIDLVEHKIQTQKKYIRDVTSLVNQAKKDTDAEIEEVNQEMQNLLEENKNLTEEIDESSITDIEKVKADIDKVSKYQIKFNMEIKKSQENLDFYDKNDICPTCSQDILPETKNKFIGEGKKVLEKNENYLRCSSEAATKLNETLDSLHKIIEKNRKIDAQITANNNSVLSLQNRVNKLRGVKKDVRHDLSEANAQLTKINDTKTSLQEARLKLIEDRTYNQAISEMLKDSGIKTKIIKQYLPAMNKLINQYLKVFDFFVLFELDDEFNETIKARYRDEFSYGSFSEGEKDKIDLSIMFAWRQIAAMKNSISTNLLFLDEVGDASLDTDSLGSLMRLLSEFKNLNAFVISHRVPEDEDKLSKFSRVLEVKMNNNFSEVV